MMSINYTEGAFEMPPSDFGASNHQQDPVSDQFGPSSYFDPMFPHSLSAPFLPNGGTPMQPQLSEAQAHHMMSSSSPSDIFHSMTAATTSTSYAPAPPSSSMVPTPSSLSLDSMASPGYTLSPTEGSMGALGGGAGPHHSISSANTATPATNTNSINPYDPSRRSSSSSSSNQPLSMTSNGSQKSKMTPKPKFSQEDDDLLIELKENQKLTWRQIAEHFDGRTAGALQVRYCTRLKGRSVSWPDNDIQDLSRVVEEYEDERWNAIAAKLGGKYSASACREKFRQLQKKTGDFLEGDMNLND